MNKKIRFSLLTLLVMLCGTVFADSYTITFKSNGTDSDGTTSMSSTDISDYISDGAAYVSAISASGKVYVGQKDWGLKFGNSSSPGTVTLTLAETVKPTSIVMNASPWGATEGEGLLQDKTFDLTTTGKKGTFADFTYNYDGETEVSTIVVGTKSKRGFVKSVTVYYESAGGGSGDDNTVTNYAVDFNNTISTTNHDFTVASNWGHIVGSNNYDSYGPYYMYYGYSADGGVDGSGALNVGAQNGYWMGSTQSQANFTDGNYDYLITPTVNGVVSLRVKRFNVTGYESYVKVFKVNDAGTVVGDEVTTEVSPAITADEWSTLTLTLTEATRLAIRAQSVTLDNFTAASATIVPVKKLTVTGVMNEDKQNDYSGTNPTFEQQSDGKLKVVLKVGLLNEGDVDLTAGMDGFSLTPASATSAGGPKTFYEDAVVNLPRNIAAGAVDTVDVEFLTTLPEGATDGKFYYWFIRENVSASVSSHYRYAKTALYEPKFVFRVAEGTATSSLTTAQTFGTISEETTKQFEIVNTGVAPLTIKSITLPEGFTSANAPTAEFVLAKNAVQALDITLPVTTTGSYSGNLTIVYLDKNNAEQTYTLAFSGNVLAPGTWFADFDNTTSGIQYPLGSVAESGIQGDYNYANGVYNYYLKSYTSSSYATENNKFITPKLHANAGDELTFEAKQGTYTSSNAYFVKVYKSTDRKNWGEPVAEYYYNDLSSSFEKKTISFAEEGDYYVAFAIFGVYVDNIIGLTKVDVTHDLYFKSISWPAATVNSGASLSKPTVDIIPLTNEVADNYTVKYYFGEEAKAQATSVDLTASANSSKTFSFAFTPEVEATQTFATKIVFEFTDGTKFESDPFNLTVVKEPKFHFVNSIPTSKWYEPSDRTAPIDFGKTNTADVQTFYVYNWGAAALNVKSITLPAGFTASVETPFTVAAFNESDLNAAAQQVDITFSATEAGTYSGDMVITYVNGLGNDSTFTLPISGTKLDPTKFYASFDTEATWPAGSVYQKNISATNGGTYSVPNYYISATSTTENVFALPKMHVAAGDKLQFDAKIYSSYWNDGKVVVYTAATRSELFNAEEGTTRKQVFSISGQDAENPLTTDYQTIEVTFAEAGDYYVGLEISNRAYVDEIYGLAPVAVAHDIEIGTVTIPAEAMQNNPVEATVNILNRGFAAEDSYDVLVHVGNDVATIAGTAALPLNYKEKENGTAVTFKVNSPKAGTIPVFVEVKAGDFTVATAPVNVVFAEEIAMADAIQIGTKSGSGRDYGFVDWYNNDGSTTRYTDIVYPAAKLTAAGMKAGDKINSIAFRANCSAKTFKAVVTSWVGTSTGEVTLGTPNKESMTEVSLYNGEVAFPANFESVIDISATPIVWDGTSDIRVYTEAVGQGSQQWISASYDYDSEINMSYNGTTKAAPLAYFTLAAEPATFAGTVKSEEGDAIANANVLLVSNDGDNVQYTGTTDAEGAFNFNVLQPNRNYVATVTAAGFKPVTETVEFAGASQTKDFVMVFDPSTAIVNADFEGDYSIFTKPNSDRAIYQPAGWTVAYTNGETNDMTALNSSCLAWNNFSGKPQLATGGNNTYWVRFRWGNSENLTLSQTLTLPAGEYRMTADAFFNGAESGSATISAAGVSKNITGNSTWGNYAIDFTLTEKTAVTFAFNVKQGKAIENIAAFDNFKLNYKFEIAKAALVDEIAKAEALKTEARTEGLEEFNAAIETAKGFLTSTDAAAIDAAVEALKAAETAFLTANLPLQENTYYVYNPLTEKFLSRGNAWGTRALVDDYGVAIKVAVTDLAEGKYTLTGFDNNASYGLDTWMYSDKSGADVRSFTMTASEDGFVLTNTNNNLLMYVYTKDDAEKYCVAGNGIKGDNYTDDAQTVWQFLTKEERDAKVAAREAAQKTAAFAANDILGDAELTFDEATELTFATGHTWTQTVVRTQGGQPATNANGTEMWQATGNYTQTITDLPAGLYKVSIQAFYRNGGPDECVTRYNSGYNTVLAYLEANGNKVQVKSWAADKGEGNDPNSMDQAKAKFDEGKYLAETYASVGEDGVLNLTVNNPAFVGNGWFIAGNVKFAKAEEVILAGDANRDGEVTTADAVATVSFALEVETPSEKAFKAADVNNSNSITVSDAVGIVNIALGVDNDPSTARGEESVNYLTLNGTEMGLMNTTEFVGFQMDVTLAEGATFNGVELASRAANLQVVYNRLNDNTYRIIAFSAANAAIEGNEGALFSLNISGNNNISVTNIEFADAAARAYALGFGDVTGINAVAAGTNNAEYYTVGGVKSNKAQKGMNVVRTADGKVKKVFVK